MVLVVALFTPANPPQTVSESELESDRLHTNNLAHALNMSDGGNAKYNGKLGDVTGQGLAETRSPTKVLVLTHDQARLNSSPTPQNSVADSYCS